MKAIILSIAIAVSSVAAFTAPAKAMVCYNMGGGKIICND